MEIALRWRRHAQAARLTDLAVVAALCGGGPAVCWVCGLLGCVVSPPRFKPPTAAGSRSVWATPPSRTHVSQSGLQRDDPPMALAGWNPLIMMMPHLSVSACTASALPVRAPLHACHAGAAFTAVSFGASLSAPRCSLATHALSFGVANSLLKASASQGKRVKEEVERGIRWHNTYNNGSQEHRSYTPLRVASAAIRL